MFEGTTYANTATAYLHGSRPQTKAERQRESTTPVLGCRWSASKPSARRVRQACEVDEGTQKAKRRPNSSNSWSSIKNGVFFRGCERIEVHQNEGEEASNGTTRARLPCCTCWCSAAMLSLRPVGTLAVGGHEFQPPLPLPHPVRRGVGEQEHGYGPIAFH